MDEIILSICISAYNRNERCCKLIEKILTIEDSRYNIYVCDDCSDDDSLTKLHTAYGSNNKVIVKKNAINVGPCKNWYNTINSGNGKYILHILDRDTIDIEKIKKLIDFLENNDEISGGYIGHLPVNHAEISGKKTGNGCVIYKQGKEAFLKMGGIPIHPTGFLVNRKQWQKLDCKKYFYMQEKYGIYPHSYVLAEMAVAGDLVCVPGLFWYRANSESNKKSRFYSKTQNKDYWWLPDSVLSVAFRLIYYTVGLPIEAYREEFVLMRFREELYRATMTYKSTVGNTKTMSHYGLKAQQVSKRELMLISIKHVIVFYVFFLKKIDCRINKRKVFKIWMENVEQISANA